MDKLKLPVVECQHCFHKWIPRKEKPIWCPKCMHPDFKIKDEN